MPFHDIPLKELETYRPGLVAPVDFDERWSSTLAEARLHDPSVTIDRVAGPMSVIDVDDVTFSGFGGDPVKAWLLRPSGASGKLPIVVEYNGYGGGRGLPHERLLWPAAGYAYLLMDSRGQGSAWGSGGETADASGGGDAGMPALPGFMTRGVLSFDTYYFRRLITDAVRALDAVACIEGIDAKRIAVAGASQGGGLAIAAAGLVPEVSAALIDVPFMCHIGRGIQMAEQDPYQEVARYLSVHRLHEEHVLRTLSYVDGVHHASRAHAPALFSAGLRDDVCPPSTVFAAFHAWAGPSRMITYPYNGHEGGHAYQQVQQAAFLSELWGIHDDTR